MPGYIDQLTQFLSERYPQPNPLWNVSSNNQLPADWLCATPVNVWGKTYADFKQPVAGSSTLELQPCASASGSTQQCVPVQASVTKPGDPPQDLLAGHSYQMVDALYETMISAEICLDFTTLTPPTTTFEDAFRNAMTFISNKPEAKRPIIRILYSNPLPNFPSIGVTPFLESITDQLDPTARMEIYVTVMSSSFSSWNHAKIVVADGTRALVGGHNMWGPHYLGVNPVFDVSMKLSGSAARHAQEYANSLWNYELWRAGHLLRFIAPPEWHEAPPLHAAYKFDASSGRCKITYGVYPDASLYPTAAARFPPPATTPGAKVLAIGRGGDTRSSYLLPTLYSYVSPFTEPSDEALVELVKAATTSIRLSVQAFRVFFGLVAGYNNALFNALAAALQRGVDLKIVISNPGAVAGGLTALSAPYQGEPPSTINEKLLSTMTDVLNIPKLTARQAIAAHCKIASFRYSADKTYPNNTPISNHAKTLIVDEKVFYIGSQNMYASNLNEFGFVVEDDTAAQSYLAQYWTPLWTASSAAVDTSFDDDFSVVQQYEAVEFILALDQNTRMAMVWDDLLNRRMGSPPPDKLVELDQAMDELIVNGGFVTTLQRVLDARRGPFFTENPGAVKANAEALRFVTNMMTSTDLMEAFAKIIDTPTQTVDEANGVIANFLKSKGYGCTALQVRAAFIEMRRKVQAYWSGSYMTWVTADGGASYTLNTTGPFPRANPRLRTLAGGDDTPVTPELGPQLVMGQDGAVSLDGQAIKNAQYDNNSLTWTNADNATAASLSFGVVTRATLNDGFQGTECFGTITYDDNGARPKGVYSFYGRLQSPAKPDDASPDDKAGATVGYVLGAIALAALLAAIGFFVWRNQQRKAEYMRIGREKRDSDASDFEMKDIVDVSSPDRSTEFSVINRSIMVDGMIPRQRMSLSEITQYASAMNRDQLTSLEQCGSIVQEASRALQNPTPESFPKVISTQRAALSEVGAVIERIADAVSGELSTKSGELIRNNSERVFLAEQTMGRLSEEERTGESIAEEIEI